MSVIFPRKLRRGDLIRVVAPAETRPTVQVYDHTALIERRFDELGLRLSYGKHVDDSDIFDSTSIAARTEDIHAAFADEDVTAILTAIGGYNSNELLPYLDWELIAKNPKIFCGYSDVTAIQNAILARAGLVTYSGPHWSTFGMRDHFDGTRRSFHDMLFETGPLELSPSTYWTDDAWFADQENRMPLAGEGWWPLRSGHARGRLVGGNLGTLSRLQGTPYMPSLTDTILFVEEGSAGGPGLFACLLTGLLQLPTAVGIRGVLIGRCRRASGIDRDMLQRIVLNQPLLAELPVLANVDFGHTNPMATLPIGGMAELSVGGTGNRTENLIIIEH